MTGAEGRRFGLVVGGAFGALAALSWWRGNTPAAYLLGALSVALMAGGLLIPTRLGPVQRRWMQLATIMSRVTTPIVMGVIFFVVITPVGLVMRLFGRNPIRHRAVNGSYWSPRTDARGDMTNQF